MTKGCLNILGVVRNGGAALADTLARIDLLQARLQDSRVLIATNDNTDDTEQRLSAWSHRTAGRVILRLDGLSDQITDRVERITHARNVVLDRLFDGAAPFDQTLILDLDGPNARMDPDAILRAMSRIRPEWDAVFGNAQPAYYDLYALRCTGWCDEDVWQRIHSARKPLMFRRRWRQQLVQRVIFDRQYHIPTDAPLIPVQSAFAGLGLYRTDALRRVRYACRDARGKLVCEHVLLHQQMLDGRARLFIDPALTVQAPREHLGATSGAPFPGPLLQQWDGPQN